MLETPWTDDQLRTFLSKLRAGSPFSQADPQMREVFLPQAHARVVPAVMRAALGDVGALVDPGGVAALTYDVLIEEHWSEPMNWLLVSTNPWDVLVELVASRVRVGYRRVAKISGRSTELEEVTALTESTDPPGEMTTADSDG